MRLHLFSGLFLAGLSSAALFLSVHLLAVHPAHAQHYPKTFRLVMFETRSCYYCKIFNETVMPQYEQHRLSFQAPIHRVDLDTQGLGGYRLKSAVIATPTIVMLNRGREVSRVTGFLPAKKFYKAVRYMIRKAKKAERRYQRNLEWETSYKAATEGQ